LTFNMTLPKVETLIPGTHGRVFYNENAIQK